LIFVLPLQILYNRISYDPVTTIARFKEEPSINKIITEEKETIGKVEAKEHLRSRRDSIFASLRDDKGDVTKVWYAF